MIPQDDGFVQWFVVNESDKEVRFDDHSDRIASSQLFEEYHYYPFGLPMTGICVEGYEMRRFTGKEMQADLGWQDHGARFYDPALGRWTAPDPLAEEYPGWSPYRYGFNNPMVYIDPTGLIEGQYHNDPDRMAVADGEGGGSQPKPKTYLLPQVEVVGHNPSKTSKERAFAFAWTAALAEPTPFGEVIMGGVTLGVAWHNRQLAINLA